MFKRIIKGVSATVLILAVLSIFGHLIQRSDAEENHGTLARVLNGFASFPEKVMEVMESNEIRNVPPTFEMYHHFERIDLLDRDIYGLGSAYDVDSGDWHIELFNFKDDSVHHRWVLTEDDFVHTDLMYRNSEPRNCILLPDRSLIASNDESTNMYRLDSASNIIWNNTDRQFHHSMNLSADSNIWVCTTRLRFVNKLKAESLLCYEDESITEIDAETGAILFDKSITDIFVENGYRNFIYGFTHRVAKAVIDDQLHLNDIEPVLADGPFWQKDDLLLSFRHLSLIVLYRPSTNSIKRLIFGPFLLQHDVDILSDSVISIFNNEESSIGKQVNPEFKLGENDRVDSISFSNIITYNMADSTFSHRLKHHFDNERIFTSTQGLHHDLSNGDVYVESHCNGIQYFMKRDSILYKKQRGRTLTGWVERPHWIRIYENINF